MSVLKEFWLTGINLLSLFEMMSEQWRKGRKEDVR